jgi:hypothetical protein
MYAPQDLIFLLPDVAALPSPKGQFAKGILLLLLEEPAAPGNEAFLAKVLAAAQLDLEQDTLRFGLGASDRLDVAALLRARPAQHILVFGIAPEHIGLRLDTHPYQWLHFQGANWLFADALSTLEPDRAKKGLLWAALKANFL